jgi:ribose-phosphate pyrophosphokinase
MIRLFIDNKEIDTGRIVFSDGAYGFNLKDLPETAQRIVFSVDPSTKVSTILDELYQLECSIPSILHSVAAKELFIPYLPYGRADRKFSENGNFGLQSFMFSLECLGLDKMTVVDPHNHSELLKYFNEEFLPDLEIITQRQALAVAISKFHVDIKQYDAIVAPDKGAVDKAQEIANYYGLPLIVCTKQRDPLTGKLSNPVVNGDVSGLKLLIVDDIFDAGGTFIQLATELQKQVPARIDLYVTHLIGAKGLDILHGKIDNVFCYHTVAGYVTMFDVYDFNSNFNLGE